MNRGTCSLGGGSAARVRRLAWLADHQEGLYRSKLLIKAAWLSTLDNIADTLTRPDKFHLFRSRLPSHVLRCEQVHVPAIWEPAWLRSGRVY